MPYLKHIKMGLLCVIILQVISLFYLLHVYNEFVSNPKNYYVSHAAEINQAENQ